MAEQRRGNPRWVKGGPSPNPSGRPAGKTITSELRRQADPEAIARAILDLAMNPAGIPHARLTALTAVVDRLEGRPLNRSEIVAEIRTADPYDELSDEELEALEERERAILAWSLPEATGLLLAGEQDEPADVVQDLCLTPGSEARTPSLEAPPAETRSTPGAATTAIAAMAARAERRNRTRSEP